MYCLVKQVFKELEFLGWYTTGGPPDPSDIHVHKQVFAPAHRSASRGVKRGGGGHIDFCGGIPLPGV